MPSQRHRLRLRRIIAGYTINRFGTWFGYIALSLAVFEHTHSAIAVAGLVIAAQALPAFLVPALVARIESSTRRAGLSALYAFEAVTTVALAVLLWNFWLPAILLLVALDGTAALAASALLRAEAARAARDHALSAAATDAMTAARGAPTPAAHAPVVELPPGETPAGETPAGETPPGRPAARELSPEAESHAEAAERKANAALNIAFSLTFVLGPGLAGLLVAGLGAPVALLIDAATFVVCGVMLVDLSPNVEPSGEATVRARLREAWGHINKVPALRTLLISEGIALIFFASDAAIEVPYAKVTLNAGDSGYGLILTVWGLGVGVGSLVFARAVHRHLGVMLSGGALAVGLGYVGFAAAPTLALACVASLLGGVGNGVQWASMLSVVQQLTPASLQAQLMGAVESIGALCPGLGLMLGGALVEISSARTAFLIVGLGAAATTAAFVRVSASPALRRPLERGEQVSASSAG